MTQSTRPQISPEFLQQNVRKRIIAGAAQAFSAKGYDATISDIIKAARVARLTFYDNFSGKKEVALALVAALGVETVDAFSVNLLLIEAAAMHHADKGSRASELLLDAEQKIRFFEEADLVALPSFDDPLEGKLPVGRSTLSPSFKSANQRSRLLSGTAAAIADRGWAATRIADIQTYAAVSRRVFYEHFDSVASAARAMVDRAVKDHTLTTNHGCGLYAVCVEIVAQRLVAPDADSFAGTALGAVYAMTTALEGGVPA